MKLGHAVRAEHLPPPKRATHPIFELMLARVAARSRRGARDDDAVIALAIEGGGLAGAVSAGMCVVLEQTGLIEAIDLIYGTSSGALNGSFTASGQAALGSTNYLDTANRRFANPLRLLRGRPAIDFDFLFEDVIRNRKPFDPDGVAAGPPFYALGVDLTTSELQVLCDFRSVDELMVAIRVSCSLPLLSGPPIEYRDVPMADGGLIESMPYASAFAGGATHVVVLRSRPDDYRKDQYPNLLIELVRRRSHEAMAPLMQERPQRYNEEAIHLSDLGLDDPTLVQITPARTMEKVSQLERSDAVIRQGMTAGAAAAAQSFGLPSVDLFWQPVVYTAS
jgi:predicted patatin/cPLA2 family phospholipase